jgi:hypothetical protein
MTEYTIEIYKVDRRRKDGKRFIEAVEVKSVDREGVEAVAVAKTAKDPKLTYEIHETYREVRNIMSGKIVKEHYKTPYSCSVGSESYFCS